MYVNNKLLIGKNSNGELYISSTRVENTGSSQKQAIYNLGGYLEISGTAYLVANNSGQYGGYNRGALQNGGTTVITGGTIVSKTGIGVVNQHDSTLVIGSDDGSVDTSTPVIIAETYALKNVPKTGSTEGVFNFYDGIFKGRSGTIQGNVTDIDSNSTRATSTEKIEGRTYYTEYLQSNN